jgi:putative hydrolase of the HAD superfamily
MRADWIYTDADNTLWDTDAVFARAQLALLSSAEQITGLVAPQNDGLAYLRQFDQAIARRHHSGLRYPPALLAQALVLGLRGGTPDAVASQVVMTGSMPSPAETSAVTAFNECIAQLPALLPGVAEGLKLANSLSVPVYVVTEGPLEIARQRLERLGLDIGIAGTLSAPKSRDLYCRLVEKAKPHKAVMIGDQSDRDIRFAHESGMNTILVPSRFQPAWQSSDDIKLADAVVNNFFEAVNWAASTAALMNHG